MLKYEIIYNKLRQNIQTGDLPAGAKLPSIRSLSVQFSCSKSTILSALQKLEDQHLIYAIPKSGYYVVHHVLPQLPANNDFIDFKTSSPTWHAFPYKDFQHCINKAIDTYQTDLFRYGTPNGLPSLIAEAKRLLETYQVFANTEQIFITSGVQQALSLLSLMPFPNQGTKILVEQPSYHLYMQFLKTYQFQTEGIERTAAGIDLEKLERIFQNGDIKFFYTMPRFHNPLGTSYDKATKLSILRLAIKYDVYIVEDDFLADFEQDTKQDPLFAEDIHERVIYLKSFSKIMFPGLRIGLAVLPKTLTKLFQQFKNTIDIDSSMISQAALELYLKSGMFARYQKHVSAAYTARAKALQLALETYLPMYTKPNEICMHSHIVLPKQINLNALISNTAKQHILLDSIRHNYVEGFYQDRILKLNVSNIEAHQIDNGIRQITDALQNKQNHYV